MNPLHDLGATTSSASSSTPSSATARGGGGGGGGGGQSFADLVTMLTGRLGRMVDEDDFFFSGKFSFASPSYSVLESAGFVEIDVLLHRLERGRTAEKCVDKSIHRLYTVEHFRSTITI